jgi:hypothetical protein
VWRSVQFAQLNQAPFLSTTHKRTDDETAPIKVAPHTIICGRRFLSEHLLRTLNRLLSDWDKLSPRRGALTQKIRCCIGEREFGGPETARPKSAFWPKQSPQSPKCRRQSPPIAGCLLISERIPNSNECVVVSGGLELPARHAVMSNRVSERDRIASFVGLEPVFSRFRRQQI